MANAEIGGRDHPYASSQIRRDGMTLNLKPDIFEKRRGPVGMSLAIAGRIVRAHADKFREQGNCVVEPVVHKRFHLLASTQLAPVYRH